MLAPAGGIALLVEQPYLFPSPGPTVVLFFESPRQRSAVPRNTLIGHGVTRELLAVAAGVLLVTVLGAALDRFLGVRQPLRT